MNNLKKTFDFWFSIGSTYTFLTVSRIRKVIDKNNIKIRLRPFNVRAIMLEMDNRPFTPSKQVKVNHMWRDIQRRSKLYNIITPKLPVPYPIKNMELANQIALLGIKEGWCFEYLEKTYYNWFIRKQPAGEEENIINTLDFLHLDYEKTIVKAKSKIIQNDLVKQTRFAKSKGIFGAPTFLVKNELFWGDDRLEDAIKWYKKPFI